MDLPKFSEKQDSLINRLRKMPFLAIKMQKVTIRLWNKLCPACQEKQKANPSNLEHCEVCTPKVKPEIDKLKQILERLNK